MAGGRAQFTKKTWIAPGHSKSLTLLCPMRVLSQLVAKSTEQGQSEPNVAILAPARSPAITGANIRLALLGIFDFHLRLLLSVRVIMNHPSAAITQRDERDILQCRRNIAMHPI